MCIAQRILLAAVKPKIVHLKEGKNIKGV